MPVLTRCFLALVVLLAGRGQEKAAFECQLVLSADLVAADRWDTSDEPNLTIASTKRVVRGQHFLVYPFLRGFARDKAGESRIDLDVRILRPDRMVYHEAKGQEAIRGKTGTAALLLPEELVGVSFDPADPLGTYRVELVARDRVGKGTSKVQESIELVAYAEGPAFEDMDELWAWAWSYHRAPDPCRAAAALRTLAREGLEEITNQHGALVELLERNAWLFPILFDGFAGESAETRALLLWILARSSAEPEAFLAALDEAERETFGRLAAESNPLEEPIAGRADLNELLGRYALSRARAPLLRLVQAFAPEESGVVADLTMRDPNSGIDVPLARVVPLVVAKSLARYASDPITRGYLAIMAADEGLPVRARAEVTRLLGESSKAK